MLLQLHQQALSNYLVVDHVAHSKFDASSSPKEKNRTPSVQENEGAKANRTRLLYSTLMLVP